MSRRAERRLERAFGAILCAVLPGTIAQACSSTKSDTTNVEFVEEETPDQYASSDVRATEIIAPEASDDGGLDPDANIEPIDGHTACTPGIVVVDPGPEAGPDADPHCIIDMPCGMPTRIVPVGCELYHVESDGSLTDILCRMLEDAGCAGDASIATDGSPITVECMDCPGGAGRATAGLTRLERVRAHTALGAWFARMAHGEAASVVSFVRLRKELVAFGAPPDLPRRARSAARDEARHARLTSSLARARGAHVPRPEFRRAGRDSSPRSIATVARENAVEGCVREAFGALLLAYRARTARDPDARAVLAQLADDELRHAALAFDVGDWLERGLTRRERNRIARARARTLARMKNEILMGSASSAARADIGEPTTSVALAMLSDFQRRVLR